MTAASDSGATAPPLSLPEFSSPVMDEGHFSGAPPSPSTLTDIILSLHASLYGAKRSVEEIREMVWRYYDNRAEFDSPVVSARGRERIADQFVLAFALPGLEVRSELRDVICSDFEFDGTRAGLIDHTVRVTLFPQLWGTASDTQTGARTPTTNHGSITPHPFFNYQVGNSTSHDAYGSAHRRRINSFAMSPVTPCTPGGSTRASTLYGSGGARNHMNKSGATPITDTPPEMALPPTSLEAVSEHALPPADDAPPLPMSMPVPPTSATRSRWSAPDGLGRRTAWSLFYDVIRPSRALRRLFTVELRIFSRLEFNEAGRIVQHEDTWSARELLEGIFPFLSFGTFIN